MKKKRKKIKGKTAAPPPHAVTDYAQKVASGQIVAGQLVRMACKRQLEDLKQGSRRGIYFDPDAADHALDFFPTFLRFGEGVYAGQPFVLQPWEQFIVGSLFGWMAPGGFRRFRVAYIEVGKGNGKTPLAAGIGLYGLMMDGEEGAEVYSAAVTRDQAAILFTDAKKMAESSPELKSRLDILEHNIAYLDTQSYFRPVSSEARSLDGKRVHMGLIDEIHEHRTALVVDKMRLGTKGRAQPMIVMITNAGYDRQSVCRQQHEYSRAVLERREENDSLFAYIAQLDPCADCKKAGKLAPSDDCKKCDDWRDEKVWPKANPNLDVSIPRLYLRELVREAVGMPAKQNIVKRLNFCQWTEQEERWFDLDLWDAGAADIDFDALKGRICFGGLDLSSNRDLSARSLLFPPQEEGQPWIWIVRLWIPEENVKARVEKDGVPYDVWIQQGFIETTPGNVIDKDFIEEAILEDAEVYKIHEVAYDRLFADQLVQHLEGQKPSWKGEEQWCVPFGMGFYSMAAPCREMERLIGGKLIQHGGNPVLRWMAGNVSTTQDPAGNKKPVKVDDKKRIDGIVSGLMALGRAMVQPQINNKSVYDERGLLTI